LEVVGFPTTSAISVCHHQCCEFEPRSGEVYSIQHYVIKFVSDLRQVGGFLRVLLFSPPIKVKIVECGVKHHKPNQPLLFFSRYRFPYWTSKIGSI